MKISIAFFAVTLLTATACADDVIIESRKEGLNNDKYKEMSGNWIDSNNPPTSAKSSASGLSQQTIGARKVMLQPNAAAGGNEPIAAARFSPAFSSPGHYYVYASWPKASNANPVNFSIKHSKGEETKTFVQDGWGFLGRENGNTWIPLGDYDFSSGPDQYVEMRVMPDTKPADTRTAGQVYSDSVRFSSQPLAPTEVLGADVAASAAAGTAPGSGASGMPMSSASTPPAPSFAGSNSGTSLPPIPGLPSPAGSSMSSGSDTATLNWQSDLPSAQREAARTSKNILIFFYSPESERSKSYESQIFSDAQVKGILKDKFVLLKINLAEQAELASKLSAFKAGTINLYNSRGENPTQFSEALTASELASRLRSY